MRADLEHPTAPLSPPVDGPAVECATAVPRCGLTDANRTPCITRIGPTVRSTRSDRSGRSDRDGGVA
jgi:hypothetical protein